ncbi:astacin-like metalloendopeptidase [Boleophthalmus pectinirostris]|uniref:astacin-like metalloendopeptidase n=1 Tax=Boleophthalmus pectinirostris TaxID=150288 RepID=UPI00242C606E|nr:astacin-like metalloendopeptidase [Boleophthalmus pectinirostris]
MKYAKCILGAVVLFTLLITLEMLKYSRHQQSEKLDESVLDILSRRLCGAVPVPKHINRKWPRSGDGNVYVPCAMDNSFSSDAKAAFAVAVVLFNLSTCIRFIARTNESDYLHIQPSSGCRSLVGRQGGLQPLDLKYPECFEVGTIHHELLHALGFHHEHNRWDRDPYIRVLWDNIRPRDKGEFKKRPSLNQITPYDYNSIMHYNSLSSSKNGLPTIEALRDGVVFGMASSMSESDIERVNRVYCRGPDKPTI